MIIELNNNTIIPEVIHERVRAPRQIIWTEVEKKASCPTIVMLLQL